MTTAQRSAHHLYTRGSVAADFGIQLQRANVELQAEIAGHPLTPWRARHRAVVLDACACALAAGSRPLLHGAGNLTGRENSVSWMMHSDSFCVAS